MTLIQFLELHVSYIPYILQLRYYNFTVDDLGRVKAPRSESFRRGKK